MSQNYASDNFGAKIYDFSSECEGCESSNVLTSNNSIWLSESGMGLPQWICIDLHNCIDEEGGNNDLILRTIGYNCWHAYQTNPKSCTLHVSRDGQNFKVWDYLTAPMAKGTHLFCTPPIAVKIYPFVALEVTETHGGEQTYINRIFLYSDEIPPSPGGPSFGISQSQIKGKFAMGVQTPLLSHLEVDDEVDTPSVDAAPAAVPIAAPVADPNRTPSSQMSGPFFSLDGDSLPVTENCEEGVSKVDERLSQEFSNDEVSLNPFESFDAVVMSSLEALPPLSVESLSPLPPQSSKPRRSPFVRKPSPDEDLLSARVIQLEENSRRLMQEVAELRDRSPTPPPSSSTDEQENAVEGKFHNNTASGTKGVHMSSSKVQSELRPPTPPPHAPSGPSLEDLFAVVQNALQRVEERHAAFIEGFSMASGRTYSDHEHLLSDACIPSDVREHKLPPQPDLANMKLSCGVTKRVRMAAKKGRSVPMPRKRSPRSGKTIDDNMEPPQGDSEMLRLQQQLDAAKNRKALKEAQLRVLIQHTQRSQDMNYTNTIGRNHKLMLDNAKAKVNTHWK
jgi:hypothetical protein